MRGSRVSWLLSWYGNSIVKLIMSFPQANFKTKDALETWSLVVANSFAIESTFLLRHDDAFFRPAPWSLKRNNNRGASWLLSKGGEECA